MDQEEKRKIEAETLKSFIGFFFESHIYTFNGKIYKPKEGGPIGPRATCALARCVMNYFDGKLSHVLELNCVKVELMRRYVDDVRILMRKLRRGCRWQDGRIIWSKADEARDNLEGVTEVQVTHQVPKNIMNEVVPGLTFTTEKEEDFDSKWCLCTLGQFDPKKQRSLLKQ